MFVGRGFSRDTIPAFSTALAAGGNSSRHTESVGAWHRRAPYGYRDLLKRTCFHYFANNFLGAGFLFGANYEAPAAAFGNLVRWDTVFAEARN